MPPLPLTALLQSALPGLSGSGRTVVSALACFNGDAGSARRLAVLCGMQSRYQLARALRRQGLPQLDRLVAGTRVLRWLLEAERTGWSLLQLAHRDGVSPAVAYRLVYRTTSLRWSQARRAGLDAVVRRLADTWGRHGNGGDPATQAGPAAAPLSSRRVARGRGPGDTEGAEGVHDDVPRPLPVLPKRHPTGRMAARLPMSDYPFDVVVGPNGVAWVSRCHAAAIDCLQLDPLRSIGSVHTGAVPTRIALAHTHAGAYVTNQFADEIGVLDLRRGAQVGAIPMVGNPLGAQLSLDGRTLYVTTNLDHLHTIWLPTGHVIASVPIPMACTSLVLHPAGTRLFVPTFRAGGILEIDARTLKTIRRFDLGGVVHELACTPDGLHLYATNEDGWLDVIHLTTGQRESRLLGSMAHGLALSPDGSVLYVGLLQAGGVAVVDRETLTMRATIPTGGKPRRIAFHPSGGAALITNESGWVDIIE